ncbi:MAG: hypothetical protein HFJ09_10010 [Lachnospiraceae bacterium]|nr:hypothetical protein [Lachnospiraceae bacterium]
MDTVGYILIGLAVLAIIFMIKSKYDERELLAKMKRKIGKEWGNLPTASYTHEKFSAIAEFYRANPGKYDVDDITWNDVDMDTIFMMMNQTGSSMGEDYLYALLRRLEVSPEKLKEREELISFFQKNAEDRQKLQLEFHLMGKLKNISLYQYLNRIEEIPSHSPIASIFMSSMLVVSILLMGLSVFQIVPAVYGVVLFVCTVVNNIIYYFQRKSHIEKYYNVFMYIIRMLEGAKTIEKNSMDKVEPYLKRLREISHDFAGFERGSFIVFCKGDAGSMWDVLLDYVRMLFHFDLIKFDSMAKKVKNHQKKLNEMYEILGFLDSMIAVASFRTWLGEEGYCIPKLISTKKPKFYMEKGYHPMITEPVSNSIKADRPVLITGSNASGKSTFIKTAAINGILAQTVHTAAAKTYEASYFKILSSMALRDDLQGNESYYIVEIKSLKRILDQIEEELPTLCFVDEVLRGTNTLERIAASSQILKSFADTNAICFAATHDLELTHILEKHYDNYHFQEQVEEGNVLFDYILRSGKAISRNAIKLLGMMGYQKDIIEKAENLANTFLEKGIWKQV